MRQSLLERFLIKGTGTHWNCIAAGYNHAFFKIFPVKLFSDQIQGTHGTYQCFGSGSGFIRIQIAKLDLDPNPYSESRSGSWKCNLAIKIHFSHKFILIFTYFLRWYQIKVLCLIKSLFDWLKTKNKYILFGLKTKIKYILFGSKTNFSQNFVFAFEKFVFVA